MQSGNLVIYTHGSEIIRRRTNAPKLDVMRQKNTTKKTAKITLTNLIHQDPNLHLFKPQLCNSFPFPCHFFSTFPIMIKSISRTLVRQSLPKFYVAPRAQRFLSIAPPPQKSRSWKNSAVRWGIAVGGLYYYNNSNVFADEPACT